jgi:hypothetical protein
MQRSLSRQLAQHGYRLRRDNEWDIWPWQSGVSYKVIDEADEPVVLGATLREIRRWLKTL